LDPSTILDFLLADVIDDHTTYFEKIRSLPAGHRLTVNSRGILVERYWRRPQIPSRVGSFGEAAREFGSLLERAVRRRLRSAVPIACHLSGGLDSTGISFLADAAYRKCGSRQPLTFLTADYGQLPCDELQYVRLMTPLLAFPDVRWDAMDTRWMDLDAPLPSQPLARGLWAGGSRGDVEFFHATGVGVLLSGIGGDELSHAEFALRDLGASLSFGVLARELLMMKAEGRTDCLRWLHVGLGGAIPEHVRFLRRRLRPKATDPEPDWLGPALRPLWNERRAHRPLDPRPSWAQADLWALLTSPQNTWFTGYYQRYYSEFGIEHRTPFHDRDLVEFVLSLPPAFRLRDGRARALEREALSRVLPQSVVFRPQRLRTGFSSARIAQARSGLDRIREVIAVKDFSAAPFVDQRAALALLARVESSDLPDGQAKWRPWWTLQSIAALECWLRLQ
jgi:asparagine synthase (glutamine-hydrolysing)